VGLDRPQRVSAKRLKLRVSNESLPDELKQVDKVLPQERAKELANFWQELGKNPLGDGLPRVCSYFWQPDQARVLQISPPRLKFAGGKVLCPPHNGSDRSAYYRQRRNFLREGGCLIVPPAVTRSIYLDVPEASDESMTARLAGDMSGVLSRLTKHSITIDPTAYDDMDKALARLQREQQPGISVFVFEDDDPASYFRVAYELRDSRRRARHPRNELLEIALLLRVLQWLHSVHACTRSIPMALSDGEFAVWPEPSLPIIYFMPPSGQHGLLYLPLFFHEFGHLLYACHKSEMDALVHAAQQSIAQMLEPNAQRNDAHARAEEQRRKTIVETWYDWMQELFCDAVGLIIGGSAFIHAFSNYLRMRGRGEFHVPPAELPGRAHPVTWLRIRLLADRAERVLCADVARRAEAEWLKIAGAMGINEDYFGFFDRTFLSAIQAAIDDMVTETAPYGSADNPSTDVSSGPVGSPCALLKEAWDKFHRDPVQYYIWEQTAIRQYLADSTQFD